MQARKSFLSAFLSLITIPAVMIVILIDKPDYDFFNFIHKNIVPIAETVGQGLTYPVRVVGRFAESRMKKKEALRENDAIMAKLSTLEKITAEKEALEKENERLAAKLGMVQDIKHRTAVVKITRDNSFMENQVFMIEVSDDAAAAGNIVVSNTGFFLGTVVERMGRFARIQSVRDGHSNIPVRIAGTDVFGFLQGGGNAAPRLRFLSDGDFTALEGMFLITSSVNGNVPENVPVGRIESVKNDEIRVKLGAELKNQESAVLLFFDKNKRYE